VFYFKLYELAELSEYSASEKNKIITIAVKLSRKDHPLTIYKRLIILSGIVILPAIVIYYMLNLNFVLLWIVLSTMLLNIKLQSLETPTIKPYIENAIIEFKNK